MQDDTDLAFDIDALFDHMVKNLNHELEDEKEWNFSLRSPDLAALERVAEELEGEFIVQLQEHVEEVSAAGVTLGDPMLSVIRNAALTAEDVKKIAQRMQKLAAERDLTYEGVNVYEPMDMEEIFGWLEPEDAGWRLRHMTDCGLEDNAALPWTFLVSCPTLESMEAIAAALAAGGFDDREDFDEPDDEGDFGTCVFVEGRNNEAEMYEAAKKISEIAEAHDGALVGIQFYTREDLEELFDDEEEE